MPLRFESLRKAHDRTTFSSGNAALDSWFRTQAGQEERRGVTRVVVAVDEIGIAGFYTLSMFSLALDAVPSEVARRLPRYPDVPAALIGRLARARRLAGEGIGERLVADALERAIQAARTVAAFAIVVDAKDEPVARFYRKIGFIGLVGRQNRFFMLAETAAKGLRAADLP